jgi:hypothetical protein
VRKGRERNREERKKKDTKDRIFVFDEIMSNSLKKVVGSSMSQPTLTIFNLFNC